MIPLLAVLVTTAFIALFHLHNMNFLTSRWYKHAFQEIFLHVIKGFWVFCCCFFFYLLVGGFCMLLLGFLFVCFDLVLVLLLFWVLCVNIELIVWFLALLQSHATGVSSDGKHLLQLYCCDVVLLSNPSLNYMGIFSLFVLSKSISHLNPSKYCTITSPAVFFVVPLTLSIALRKSITNVPTLQRSLLLEFMNVKPVKVVHHFLHRHKATGFVRYWVSVLAGISRSWEFLEPQRFMNEILRVRFGKSEGPKQGCSKFWTVWRNLKFTVRPASQMH